MRIRLVVPILAAALPAAGCEMTAPARDPGYDFRLQPENLVFRWPEKSLPVEYHAAPVGQLPDYVNRALSLWQAQFLYGEFRARRVPDTAGAEVRIELEGGAPPPSPVSNEPAVDACEGRTAIPLTGDGRLAGPIVINLRWFPAYSAQQIANCLAAVTAHEIGHSLGLLQHSDQPADLMFGAPFGFPEVREPSARDRATVQRLYHTPSDVMVDE